MAPSLSFSNFNVDRCERQMNVKLKKNIGKYPENYGFFKTKVFQ